MSGPLDRDEVQRMIEYVYLDKVAPQIAQMRNDMVRFAGDGNGRKGELQNMEARVNHKIDLVGLGLKSLQGDVGELKNDVGRINSKMDKVAKDKLTESTPAVWTIRKKAVWGLVGSLALIAIEIIVKWLAKHFLNID